MCGDSQSVASADTVERPPHRLAKVAELVVESLQPRLFPAGVPCRFRLVGEGDTESDQTAAPHGEVVRSPLELRLCELPERLQNPVARPDRCVASADEALVEEGLQCIWVGIAHLLGCRVRAAADEDR